MEYYVYAYCDCTPPEEHFGYHFSGRPFYVGYGKANRFLFHLNEAKKIVKGENPKVYNPHKTNKICKLLREGSEPRIVILKTSLSKEDAKTLEILLISNISALTNIAKGGEGGDTLSNHPRAKDWGKTFDHKGEKNPLYGRHAANNPKSKLYTFTHENGSIIKVVGGEPLNTFIGNAQLGRNKTFDLIKGRIASHKGFTVKVSKIDTA